MPQNSQDTACIPLHLLEFSGLTLHASGTVLNIPRGSRVFSFFLMFLTVKVNYNSKFEDWHSGLWMSTIKGKGQVWLCPGIVIVTYQRLRHMLRLKV